MTTVATELAGQFVSVAIHGTGLTVTAERTACPHLAISPVISQTNGVTGILNLVHIPTGYWLPRMLLADKGRLCELAEKVAGLDWNFTSAYDFPAETLIGFLQAREALEFGKGEVIFTEYPEGWGRSEDAIPGDADKLVRWLLDGWQASYDHMHKDHPDEIPMNLPDGSPNWEWIAASIRQGDTFGLAYLLAALRRVAPDTADHAAAFLAEQWASGDSIGEWVWQWRDEIEQGEPLRLPAVPSPAPGEGELFGNAS